MIAPADREALMLFDSMQAKHIQLWRPGRPQGEKSLKRKKFYKIYAVWKIRNAKHLSTILEAKFLAKSLKSEYREKYKETLKHLIFLAIVCYAIL